LTDEERTHQAIILFTDSDSEYDDSDVGVNMMRCMLKAKILLMEMNQITETIIKTVAIQVKKKKYNILVF
jgi:hypothetical protein